MDRARSRTRFLVGLVLALLVIAGAHPAVAVAQPEAVALADALAARESTSSLAGPLSGELVQVAEVSATAGAGVVVETFSATATFVNPDELGTAPWDFGFAFHSTPSSAQQIFVNSAGEWHYAPVPGGIRQSGFVLGLDLAPGATNTLELVVNDGSALLGCNGEFVGSIALPPAVAADVDVGTGFLTSTTEPGRVIGYERFEVWPLATVAQTAPDPPPAPSPEPDDSLTGAPEPAPGFSEEDNDAFAFILATQLAAVPLAGPFTANLTEEENRIALSWADVDVADFHARAVFAVPEMSSEVPWDAGFMFRTSPAGTLRVAIDASGLWHSSTGAASPALSGPAAAIELTPGAANTLDLLVANDLAVLGVNGVLTAMIDLPAGAGQADVAVGSSFYDDQMLPERVTAFRDFVVLPFDPEAMTAADQSGTNTATDTEAFTTYVTETRQIAPFAGPFAGRLVETTPGTVLLATAGVALADFGAVVTFVNPPDTQSAPWDAGFQFRGDAAVTNRIMLGSDGNIYTVMPGSGAQIVGVAMAYDATPGAANELELFVRGSRALVGVNGELVAAVELTGDPVASDVQVGAAFFDEDYAQDRATDYEGFSVWQMA